MNRFISFIGIVVISMAVFGCQNVFKSMEVLDSTDKQQLSDIAKDKGDSVAVESNAKAVLASSGSNYATASVGVTKAEKQARNDIAMVELAKLDTAPIDLLKNVIAASSSGNNQNTDFFQTIVEQVPTTTSSNMVAVLLAADNLRMNVNTANPNEALQAAAAEATAVTMILKDAGLVTSVNITLTTQQTIDKWDIVSSNLLIHSQGAVDMFNYTDSSGSNQALTNASDKLKQLQILNTQRALSQISESAFATSLNAIMGN